jgi:hypothetical protein
MELGAAYRDEGAQFPAANLARYQAVMLSLAVQPARTEEVMPTAFGNAIKAFEVYPREVYGVDGVPMWLRLAAVLPSGFAEQVAAARSQVDFMVNATFFALVTEACALGRFAAETDWPTMVGAARSGRWADLPALVAWWELAWFAGAMGAAVVCYRLATALVPAWGDLVKAAFDIGLPRLAAELGFALPPSDAARRCFWTTFSRAVTYRRHADGSLMFDPEAWPTAPVSSAKTQSEASQDESKDKC